MRLSLSIRQNNSGDKGWFSVLSSRGQWLEHSKEEKKKKTWPIEELFAVIATRPNTGCSSWRGWRWIAGCGRLVLGAAALAYKHAKACKNLKSRRYKHCFISEAWRHLQASTKTIWNHTRVKKPPRPRRYIWNTDSLLPTHHSSAFSQRSRLQLHFSAFTFIQMIQTCFPKWFGSFQKTKWPKALSADSKRRFKSSRHTVVTETHL